MRAFIVLLLPIWTLIAFAEDIVHFDRAFLYLPDAELKKRIADPDEFLNYAGLIPDAIEPTFSSLPMAGPVSFGLIVTIRTKQESKVWFSIKSGTLSGAQREHIAARIEAIPVPDVNYGVVPIAFALRAWGATDTVDEFPVAPEWAEFIDGSNAVDVIEKAWN